MLSKKTCNYKINLRFCFICFSIKKNIKNLWSWPNLLAAFACIMHLANRNKLIQQDHKKYILAKSFLLYLLLEAKNPLHFIDDFCLNIFSFLGYIFQFNLVLLHKKNSISIPDPEPLHHSCSRDFFSII